LIGRQYNPGTPHGDLVDDLADALSTDEPFPPLDARGSVADFRAFLQTHYGWALSIDHAPDSSRARFWYVSAFFGANRFDPRSDRWLRITMFQHAPFPDELQSDDADDWCYPLYPPAANA